MTGSCYCGNVAYQVEAPLGPVFNCHCAFCRRIHGAAFTTVTLIPATAITLQASSGQAATFRTPLGNIRHFCGKCASPIWNLSPPLEVGVIVVGSLADESQPTPWAHVNVESKSPWFSIEDALPQFDGWPDSETIRTMCSRHPGSWVPEPLLRRTA